MKNIYRGGFMKWHKSTSVLFKRLVIVFLLFAFPASAQKYKFENITSENGLSQNLVKVIFQDSHNLMWIGTASGLNKYDGTKFTVYKNDVNNPHSISGKHFTSIVEDNETNLWIGSVDGGVSKYIRRTESFIQYKTNPSKDKSLSGDRVYSLVIDRAGKLFIGSEDGLIRMDMKTGERILFRADPSKTDSLCSNKISCLMQDDEGKIWIGTWMGLSVLDLKTRKFTNYLEHKNNPEALNSAYIYKIYQDNEKNIWIGTFDGIYRFNKRSNNFTGYHYDQNNPNSLKDGTVKDILEDTQGNFWVASNSGGLNLFDRKRGLFTHFESDPYDKYSINSENIYCLFQDRAGILWIGSFGDGINKLDFRKSQFHYFRSEPLNKNSLSSNRVTSFYVDKDNSIWIGNLDGSLDHMTRCANSQKFQRYFDHSKSVEASTAKQIYAVSKDNEGNIWLGVKAGLKKFYPMRNKFTLYDNFTGNELKNNSVLSILLDNTNRLWIGTYRSGLCSYNKTTNSFDCFSHNKNNPNSITSNVIRYLYQDRNQNLWVCTEGGLDLFDRNNNKFIHYKNISDNPNSLIDDYVLLIFQDSQHNMWVGTPSGLCKMEGNFLDPSKVKFTRYTTSDGLLSNNIQGIEEDEHGCLWLSTINGLSRFYPPQKVFNNYDISDGLLTNEFYITAIARNPRTGEILLGSNKGFNIFHPDSIKKDKYPPPIIITGLSISNKPVFVNQEVDGKIVLSETISETDVVELGYSQNTISIGFAALSFANPEKNLFKYKMTGLSEEWIDLQNKREVSFINLSPGEYVFKVKAANHSGLWNEKEATLKIIIDPPFWQTFLFKFVVVVICLSGSVLLYKKKTRSINQRSLELQKEVERQTRELRIAKDAAETANKFKSDFLANTSHELRTPLNAILGYTQILRRQSDISDKHKDYLLTIQKSGEHLLMLINDILDLRRIKVKGEELVITQFNLRALIQEVLSTVRVKALEKDLLFDYLESSSLPGTVMGDAKKIRQILLNLLGNAIKYTKVGFVKLEVQSQGFDTKNPGNEVAQIFFNISDSGTGIAKERFSEIFTPFSKKETSRNTVESSGLGLAITKRLVELMGGEISVKSELEKGTSFLLSLNLPVKDKIDKNSAHPDERIIGFNNGPKNILIVGDHAENRSLLLSLLTPLGFEMEIAENGKIALEKINDFKPDLILVDMLMPSMDGIQLVERLKDDAVFRDAKIIGVSAAVADLKRTSVFSKSCDDFISKPINSELLFSKIGNLLNLTWRKEVIASTTYREKFSTKILNQTYSKPSQIILDSIIANVNLGDYSAIQTIIKNELGSDEFQEFKSRLLEHVKRFDEESILNLCKINN